MWQDLGGSRQMINRFAAVDGCLIPSSMGRWSSMASPSDILFTVGSSMLFSLGTTILYSSTWISGLFGSVGSLMSSFHACLGLWNLRHTASSAAAIPHWQASIAAKSLSRPLQSELSETAGPKKRKNQNDHKTDQRPALNDPTDGPRPPAIPLATSWTTTTPPTSNKQKYQHEKAPK